MNKHFLSLAATVAILLAGCGGHGVALPGSGNVKHPPGGGAKATALFVISVPPKPKRKGVLPHYVSPSTASISIAQNGGTPVVVNLSTLNPACTSSGGTLTCSASVPAAVGSNQLFSVIAYDAQNGSGNVLSQNSVTANIVQNTANQVNLTLNGVVALLRLVLANPRPQEGTPATIPLAVNAIDADNNIIVGPGSYDNGPIALSDSDVSGDTLLSTATVIDPSVQITVAYNGGAMPGGSATFSASAGGGSIHTSGAQNAVLTPSNYWTVKAAMPTARYLLSAGVVNGMLYAVGGLNEGVYLTAVEAYDPATDTWTTKAPMPTPRAASGAAVVNGILYVVGGFGPTATNIVEAYDPATDTWTTKAPMPTARDGLAVVAVNGILYAVGGYNDAHQSFLNTVEAYDPSTNTWTTKAPMPSGRSGLAAAVVNGIIYAAGGYSIALGGPLNRLEAYNPTANSWTTLTPMSTVRYELAAGELNGLFYAVGGSSSVYLNSAEAYDPLALSWTTKAPMPTARTGLAAGVLNNILYALGGNNGGNNGALGLNNVEAYTP